MEQPSDRVGGLAHLLLEHVPGHSTLASDRLRGADGTDAEVVILERIDPPLLSEVRALAAKVRTQARRAGMKPADLQKAIRVSAASDEGYLPVLDAATNRSLSTRGEVVPGRAVVVFGAPPFDPIWRTPAGIARLRPCHFGFDLDHVPLQFAERPAA